MMQASVARIRVRIEVHPAVHGGWSVTRDRVLDAEIDDRDKAIAYAMGCVERARRAGLEVTLDVHEAAAA